jgi:hypothetical protein
VLYSGLRVKLLGFKISSSRVEVGVGSDMATATEREKKRRELRPNF